MKIRKKVTVLMSAALLAAGMSGTAFAGSWEKGEEPNLNKWRYDNGDGTYARGGWQWIDGNADGIAECYYFDADGWLMTDCVTPDGYQVNKDGAWITNGAPETQAVQTQTESAGMELSGDYYYSHTAVYIRNEQSQQYELYGSTPGNVEKVKAAIQSGADIYADGGLYLQMYRDREAIGAIGDFETWITVSSGDGLIKLRYNSDNVDDELSCYKYNGTNWSYEGYMVDEQMIPRTDDSMVLTFSGDNTFVESFSRVSGDWDPYPVGSMIRIDKVYSK